MLVSQYYPTVSLPLSSMSMNSPDTLHGLPMELLIRIFSLLQVADLLSVQHTCRRFYDIISDSASLQYFLHTEVNLLEDLLLPDFSLPDRVTILKHHETAWNNLQLNLFTRFIVGSEESHARCYVLQDGYLIYKAVTDTARYGYVDLYSTSALPNSEARWTHISLPTIRSPLDIVFAVDHNLVVVISRSTHNRLLSEASFLEFTTGVHHPHSSVHTVSLPRKTKVEVLGDYILVTEECGVLGTGIFSVVSWKTGIYTQLYKLFGVLRVVVIDPDNSLIALIKSATNSIHICKLQLVSEQQPCLHTLCFLRLPIRYHTNYTNPASVFMERIPTSKPQDRTEFQTSRGRPFPFRSHRSGTIALILSFKTRDEGLQYAMFVSVEALISVAHSGASHVSWAEWGPAGTRILPLGNGIQPRPAGPFWITSYAPLVVLDYNPLRARYIKRQKKLTRTSSIPSKPSLGPRSTKLFGEHWAEGEVKTHLPFRKLVADGLYFKRVAQIVADREWIVVIARSRTGKRISITVYHVGQTETVRNVLPAEA